MGKDIGNIVISPNASIKTAMQIIEDTGCCGVLVADEKRHLVGVITDGDIRRHILKGINLNFSVRIIMNTRPIVLKEGRSLSEARDVMVKNSISLVPIVDEANRVAGYLYLPEVILELEKNGALKRTSKATHEIKKVLVIGGAGYIGSVLVRRLLECDYKVRVLDILLYGEESIKGLYSNKGFEFMRGDCRNAQDVIYALDGVDAVVHLGEIVGDTACSLSPDFTIEVNYMATKTLAEACYYQGISRFIFSSSCSVYGVNNDELTEESGLNPVSLYAKCKIESEKAILSIRDEYFNPVILRLATVYGFSHRPRFDLVINLLTAKAVSEKKIKIFGGEQWRPFVSVNDAAEAIISALRAQAPAINRQVFNVGSNEQNYQIRHIGDLIKKAVPEVEVEITKDNIDQRNYKVRFDKINEKLGFCCKRQLLDEILVMKGHILNTAGLNLDDSRFSNYKTFVGSEVS